MKKIILALLVLFALFSCGEKKSKVTMVKLPPRFKTLFIQWEESQDFLRYIVIKDRETGIQYLVAYGGDCVAVTELKNAKKEDE